MDVNPYESSSLSASSPPAHCRLRAPATSLLVCSILGFLYAIWGLVISLPQLQGIPTMEDGDQYIAYYKVVSEVVSILFCVVVTAGAINNHRQSRWYEEGPKKGPCCQSKSNSPRSSSRSCFSWSWMYALIIASSKPTVLTQ